MTIRMFFQRLRAAWRVLTGRISPDDLEKARMIINAPVPMMVSMPKPVLLRSSWWAHGPDLSHAHSVILRELHNGVNDFVRFEEEMTPDGGYQVTGILCVYKQETEDLPPC